MIGLLLVTLNGGCCVNQDIGGLLYDYLGHHGNLIKQVMMRWLSE